MSAPNAEISQLIQTIEELDEKLTIPIFRPPPAPPPSGGNGGNPHNDPMEPRISALEARLDTLVPNLATKADIAEVRGDIKGWMLSTVLTIIGTMLAAIFGVAQVMKPAPAPSVQQPPIIITVPAAPPAQPVTPEK